MAMEKDLLIECPRCRTLVQSDSRFCQACGNDLHKSGDSYKVKGKDDPFSSLGDLCDEPIKVIPPDPDKKPEPGMLFCPACKMNNPKDSIFCEHCGKRLITIPDPPPEFKWKTWMTVASCCMALIVLLAVWGLGEQTEGPGWEETGPQSGYVESLSNTCDFILCCGTDAAGNVYELVANQTETSLEYKIEVGVIKNNEWLWPLSTDFPFLGEEGLFHVSAPMGGESGSNLDEYGKIVSSIFFIDSGAFLMDSYNTRTATGWDTYDHTKIIFSCETQKSYTVDCEESSFLYRYDEACFSNGEVISYGQIVTDNGKLLIYSEPEESDIHSMDIEDHIYDWFLLNTKTLEIEPIATNLAGLCPESVLSEGLIFASDQCFYDTNLQKKIDLSAYNIDMWYAGSIFFENGECEFTAENDLGTEFLITIDKSGKVLSEVKK